jgi:hypothetical protein
MAKEQTDTTLPAWAKPSTMAILSQASTSARPPVAPYKSGGPLPENKQR